MLLALFYCIFLCASLPLASPSRVAKGKTPIEHLAALMAARQASVTDSFFCQCGCAVRHYTVAGQYANLSPNEVHFGTQIRAIPVHKENFEKGFSKAMEQETMSAVNKAVDSKGNIRISEYSTITTIIQPSRLSVEARIKILDYHTAGRYSAQLELWLKTAHPEAKKYVLETESNLFLDREVTPYLLLHEDKKNAMHKQKEVMWLSFCEKACTVLPFGDPEEYVQQTHIELGILKYPEDPFREGSPISDELVNVGSLPLPYPATKEIRAHREELIQFIDKKLNYWGPLLTYLAHKGSTYKGSRPAIRRRMQGSEPSASRLHNYFSQRSGRGGASVSPSPGESWTSSGDSAMSFANFLQLGSQWSGSSYSSSSDADNNFYRQRGQRTNPRYLDHRNRHTDHDRRRGWEYYNPRTPKYRKSEELPTCNRLWNHYFLNLPGTPTTWAELMTNDRIVRDPKDIYPPGERPEIDLGNQGAAPTQVGQPNVGQAPTGGGQQGPPNAAAGAAQTADPMNAGEIYVKVVPPKLYLPNRVESSMKARKEIADYLVRLQFPPANWPHEPGSKDPVNHVVVMQVAPVYQMHATLVRDPRSGHTTMSSAYYGRQSTHSEPDEPQWDFINFSMDDHQRGIYMRNHNTVVYAWMRSYLKNLLGESSSSLLLKLGEADVGNDLAPIQKKNVIELGHAHHQSDVTNQPGIKVIDHSRDFLATGKVGATGLVPPVNPQPTNTPPPRGIAIKYVDKKPGLAANENAHYIQRPVGAQFIQLAAETLKIDESKIAKFDVKYTLTIFDVCWAVENPNYDQTPKTHPYKHYDALMIVTQPQTVIVSFNDGSQPRSTTMKVPPSVVQTWSSKSGLETLFNEHRPGVRRDLNIYRPNLHAVLLALHEMFGLHQNANVNVFERNTCQTQDPFISIAALPAQQQFELYDYSMTRGFSTVTHTITDDEMKRSLTLILLRCHGRLLPGTIVASSREQTKTWKCVLNRPQNNHAWLEESPSTTQSGSQVSSPANNMEPTPASSETPTPMSSSVPTSTPFSIPRPTPLSVPTPTPLSVPTPTPFSVPTPTPFSVPTPTPFSVPAAQSVSNVGSEITSETSLLPSTNEPAPVQAAFPTSSQSAPASVPPPLPAPAMYQMTEYPNMQPTAIYPHDYGHYVITQQVGIPMQLPYAAMPIGHPIVQGGAPTNLQNDGLTSFLTSLNVQSELVSDGSPPT